MSNAFPQEIAMEEARKAEPEPGQGQEESKSPPIMDLKLTFIPPGMKVSAEIMEMIETSNIIEETIDYHYYTFPDLDTPIRVEKRQFNPQYTVPRFDPSQLDVQTYLQQRDPAYQVANMQTKVYILARAMD